MANRKLAAFKDMVQQQRQHTFDAQLAAQKQRYDELMFKYKGLLEEHQTLQQQQQLLDGINLDGLTPVKIEPHFSSGKSEACAIMVGGDWHHAETILKAQVNGLNEHNLDISSERIQNFWKGGLRWTEIHRGGVRIPELVLVLLGDLMTNQLHEDQLEMNQATPQEEVLMLLELILGGLDLLESRGHFERITIACCDGNHGRATEKIRKANRVEHSNEWMLYQLLARACKNRPKLRFVIAEGYHLYLDLYGKQIRVHHGDAIKYSDGVGGLTVPALKAISKWDRGRRADFDIFGHMHTRHTDTKFLANGSTLGYSPFAVSIKAPYEPPSQTLLIVDKDRWITSDNRIYV